MGMTLTEVSSTQRGSLRLDSFGGRSHWEEALGKTRDMLEGLQYVSQLAWKCLGISQEVV